jgi:hypothetical protein
MFTPTATLEELWPDDAVAALRPFDDALRWLPSTRAWCERTSVAALEYLGNVPIIAHEAAMAPRALELLREVGIQVPDEILTYREPEEMQELVTDQVRRRRRIAVSHTGHRLWAPEEAYVTPPSVIATLNDKANLADFLPAEAVSARRTIETTKLAGALETLQAELPVVLKASTRLGHGGGIDVAVCRTPDDLTAAIKRMEGTERVVVEAYQEFFGTWCMAFRATSDGVRYFGSAQQVCGEDGAYYGNWCTSVGPGASAIEFGLHAAREGWARGYRGVLGIDVGLTGAEGRPYVFDLNFRTNGSTGQVLLHEAINTGWGLSCTRACAGMRYDGSFDAMLDELYALLQGRLAVPWHAFDTTRLDMEDDQWPYASALAVGSERAEVQAMIDIMRQRGFSTKSLSFAGHLVPAPAAGGRSA